MFHFLTFSDASCILQRRFDRCVFTFHPKRKEVPRLRTSCSNKSILPQAKTLSLCPSGRFLLKAVKICAKSVFSAIRPHESSRSGDRLSISRFISLFRVCESRVYASFLHEKTETAPSAVSAIFLQNSLRWHYPNQVSGRSAQLPLSSFVSSRAVLVFFIVGSM